MKRREEWRIAFRLLRSGNILFRSFSLFCVLGVVVVMSGFVFTDAVLSGFDLAYRRALISFNGSAVMFKETAIASDDPIFDPRYAVRASAEARGERIVPMPFYYTETLLLHAGELKGLQVKGLRAEDFEGALQRYRAVRVPNPKLASSKNGVFLGRGLYQILAIQGVSPERIRLFRVSSTAPLAAQNALSLPVAGYFESGLSEFDDTFMLMGEDSFRDLVAVGSEPMSYDSYHGIEWFKEDGRVISDETLDAFRERLDDETTFLDWKELNATFFEALALEKKLFFLIAIAVMGIAVLNILILTLLQMVLRTHASRIFEVLGASQALVNRLFFKQMALLVGVGVLLGGIVGGGGMWIVSQTVSIPLSKELYFLDHLPLVSRMTPIWISGGMLLVSASIAIGIALVLGRRLQSGYRLQ